ncbi:hypothetical protein EPN96_03895 [bacterium]|nr:MAG: hypothetical protein EPN96_03895 [bacterium]
MCTLHLFFKVFPGYPVLFAANRDELLSREWDPPALISHSPWIFGPRDRLMGGTWTGVNSSGLLCSLANHHGTLGSKGSLCSRGNLVLAALGHGSASEAANSSREYSPACKSYSLLLADGKEAFVLDNENGREKVYPLEPGNYVITNRRFMDPGDAKAKRSLERMKALEGNAPDFRAIGEFLADHGPGGESELGLCVHDPQGGTFGTTSSSIIALDTLGRVAHYLFADGPPCTAPFVEVNVEQ